MRGVSRKKMIAAGVAAGVIAAVVGTTGSAFAATGNPATTSPPAAVSGSPGAAGSVPRSVDTPTPGDTRDRSVAADVPTRGDKADDAKDAAVESRTNEMSGQEVIGRDVDTAQVGDQSGADEPGQVQDNGRPEVPNGPDAPRAVR